MTSGTGFLLFLATTLLLLGGVVWTGFHAQRRLHIPLVVTAIASLGVTIFFAERLGRLYDLETAGRIYPVHLLIAKVCTAAYVLPIVTGILTLKRGERVRLHRAAAFLVLGLTLLTAVTGTWMLFSAERHEVTNRDGAWPAEVRASEPATSIPR